MGLLPALFMNYFVMVLENQIKFVIIDRRIFNYYWRIYFGFIKIFPRFGKRSD